MSVPARLVCLAGRAVRQPIDRVGPRVRACRTVRADPRVRRSTRPRVRALVMGRPPRPAPPASHAQRRRTRLAVLEPASSCPPCLGGRAVRQPIRPRGLGRPADRQARQVQSSTVAARRRSRRTRRRRQKNRSRRPTGDQSRRIRSSCSSCAYRSASARARASSSSQCLLPRLRARTTAAVDVMIPAIPARTAPTNVPSIPSLVGRRVRAGNRTHVVDVEAAVLSADVARRDWTGRGPAGWSRYRARRPA